MPCRGDYADESWTMYNTIISSSVAFSALLCQDFCSLVFHDNRKHRVQRSVEVENDKLTAARIQKRIHSGRAKFENLFCLLQFLLQCFPRLELQDIGPVSSQRSSPTGHLSPFLEGQRTRS